MAKKKIVNTNLVKLKRLDSVGGITEVDSAYAERLLRIEAKMGQVNHEIVDEDSKSGGSIGVVEEAEEQGFN